MKTIAALRLLKNMEEKCDKQGCRNKAVKYYLLSGGAVHLCRKHAQQLKPLGGRSARKGSYVNK